MDSEALETVEIPPPIDGYYENEADRPFYVYFIQADDGPIKIGRAYNIKYRMSSLLSGSWHELRLVGWVKGPRKLEAELHQRFAADRIRREWFQPSDELLAFIKGLR
jgi:hypothetical protein